MKTFFALVIVLVILISGCETYEKVDVEAEKADIQAVIEKAFEGAENQDWETFRGYSSGDWELFSHTGERWTIEDVEKFFKDHISDHQIELSDIRIQVSGDGKMAWAKHNEHTEYMFDGNPVKEDAIFTQVLEKINSDWIIIHSHRSAAPPPSEEMEEDFYEAHRKAISALHDLERVWVEDLVEDYPKYLPSFDAFVHDFMAIPRADDVERIKRIKREELK